MSASEDQRKSPFLPICHMSTRHHHFHEFNALDSTCRTEMTTFSPFPEVSEDSAISHVVDQMSCLSINYEAAGSTELEDLSTYFNSMAIQRMGHEETLPPTTNDIAMSYQGYLDSSPRGNNPRKQDLFRDPATRKYPRSYNDSSVWT